MVSTQIQSSEAQVQVLKEMAKEREASMAGLIRQAVDRWIEAEGGVTFGREVRF